jgi:hypothetical protein
MCRGTLRCRKEGPKVPPNLNLVSFYKKDAAKVILKPCKGAMNQKKVEKHWSRPVFLKQAKYLKPYKFATDSRKNKIIFSHVTNHQQVILYQLVCYQIRFF